MDDKFWVTFWKTIATFLCVVIAITAGCEVNTTVQVRKLIETEKVNPIDASCAIRGTASSQVCAMRAAK